MKEASSNSLQELLRKLIERILSQSGDRELSFLELFVGQLPPDLPFTPLLPLDCQLLGSRRHSPDVVEVLFDTPLPPTQLIHFYQEQLEEAGWYEQKNWQEQHERGFITTAYPGLGALAHFCKGPQGPSLNMFALNRLEGLTQVRMYLSTSQDDSPCKPPSEPDPRLSSRGLALNLFPRLTPPHGAQHMETGRQSTRDSGTTTALLETEHDIPLLALAAHYATQLEQASWTRTSEGHGNEFAWQTWSLRDEEKQKEWQGLFLLIKTPDARNRFYMHAYINASQQQ